MFSLIVAHDEEFGIGKDNKIPWNVPEDLAHFAKVTRGHVVIMGRKTYESIGKSLPGRINIVISRTPIEIAGTVVVHDPWDAVRYCVSNCKGKEWFVIGGETIYQWFIQHKLIDTYHITEIPGKFQCDTSIELPSAIVCTATELATSHTYCTYTSINAEEQAFLSVMNDVVYTGTEKLDRTGVGTKSIFGQQLKFSLRDHSFPLLTTRRMFLRGIFEELMLYIRGQTDNQILEDKKISVWRGNTSREFLDSKGLTELPVGDMGPSYGFLFRHFGAEYKTCKDDYTGQGVDQLMNVINTLRTNPADRRMIISLWSPPDLTKCPLPPCLYNYQFYTSGQELSCMMTQRSSDFVVAGGWNVATGALLTYMIAHVTGFMPGELIWNIGDTHVYNNLIEPAKKQLDRVPRPFPKLFLKSRNNIDITNFEFTDLEVLAYNPHPAIEMVMNV